MNWIAFVLYLLLVHGEAIVVAIFNVWLMTWRESEMPIATVSDEPEHYDLKTLPGAFVKIRRMDHGERMQRQQLLNKTRMNLRRGSKDVSVDMDLVNAAVTMYEWANLIVAHNLEYLTQPGN